MTTHEAAPMRVVYDVSILGAGHRSQLSRTGTYRVTERLAHGLAASPECELRFSAVESARVRGLARAHVAEAPALRHVPLVAPPRAGLVEALAHPLLRMDLRPSQAKHVRVVRGVMARGVKAAEAALGHRRLGDWVDADVFHSPSAPLPRWAGRGRPPARLLTVLDLIPVLFPELFDVHVLRRFRAVLASLDAEAWAICISASGRDDLCEHTGIDPARVFVTPLAAAPDRFHPVADAERIARVKARYGIPDAPYLLSLNTLEPRKNMDHAIRSFIRLVRDEGVRDLYFVLAGTKGWHHDGIFEAISGAGELRGRIILPGFVADEDLAALYSGATAFVYPSLYEGFGLPPLEAMQCGVPVITSNTSSLPEVVGDAGIMVDPRDGDALCQAMLDLYRTPALRATLRERSLARARRFSWERCTADTIAAYRTASGS
ncbi:MAG TPA: glycosyltransferase family 1 protein [Longimicrobium sp.]